MKPLGLFAFAIFAAAITVLFILRRRLKETVKLEEAESILNEEYAHLQKEEKHSW